MVGTFIEGAQSLLSQCRDLENQHHEKIMEIALINLEKSNKNELDDDTSEDLRNVSCLLKNYGKQLFFFDEDLSSRKYKYVTVFL